MTNRLVIIRHAKAGVAETDHERPLAVRGRSDASHLGHWLAERGIVPQRAVVSTALRTRQTWERVAAGLESEPQVEFDHRVYDNTIEDLLEVLQETPAEVDTVVLVGHNPGVHLLALFLDDGSGVEEVARRVRDNFPTSAVAVVEFDGEWAALGAGAGPLITYADPHSV